MSHKINVSVASLQPSNFEGWATKQGGSWKSWKRRWFVIKDRKMWYFAGKNDTEAKGWIDLTPGTEVKDLTQPGQKKKFSFSINSRGVKGEREFLIFVESETDLKGFLKAINQVLSGDKKNNTSNPIPTQPTYAPPPNVTSVSEPMAPPPMTQSYVAPVNEPTTTTQQPYVPPVPQQQSISSQTTGNSSSNWALNIPGNIPNKIGTQSIDTAKEMFKWLMSNNPEGVLDFLGIWKDSLPTNTDMEAGEVAKLTLCVSADTNKLSWRVDGPQGALIQKMVDFFWNVGAPEVEIDRLNDLGAEINPFFIGSWIDMSQQGGMDGGWFFPVDTELSIGKNAGDKGNGNSALDVLVQWAEQHGMNSIISVGRDMGATPPRQTDFKFKVVGPNQVKLTVIKEACSTFGFPPISNTLEEVICNLGNSISEITLSIITSTDGFVKLGVIIPQPTAEIISKLVESVPGHEISIHQSMLNSFGQPIAVEYSFLNKGFGFEVYREGVDVHIYYNLGAITTN
ncbi:hypothetical protein conserved domain containing [Entamoeba histolytica]|uniref:PH domain-containing protein n=3 Tax=Entamoeba histolytica TaxID=5759 RepID=C4M2H1_ENTH1|nr:uncharacterized protein EHI_040420 [Entamoeba histolytica HM-1:IMSS]EAL43973.1 hypothetical protein, conserved domain containing [Entamoeba histolytica HM-1:IMSS]ENY61023.1 PH domain containing protein [Entamoeba histolytica HM-1:IMSS-A]GAT95473.1 hypothetical protein conserved domain containing [Entamoeba histolytica]|eukprot:XP_649359.1 uncharacterized protein EHI_040420 [Entamoeba histolytica HM-1:IMSS]